MLLTVFRIMSSYSCWYSP